MALVQHQVVGEGGSCLVNCCEEVADGAKLVGWVGVDMVCALWSAWPVLRSIGT